MPRRVDTGPDNISMQLHLESRARAMTSCSGARLTVGGDGQVGAADPLAEVIAEPPPLPPPELAEGGGQAFDSLFDDCGIFWSSFL